MKIPNFFKGLSWLVLLNLVVKPVWIFAIDRQLQNVVGHEAYGSYFAILNLSIVLSFIADAGLTNMMNRKLAAGESLNLPKVFTLKLLLSLVYISIVMTVAFLSGIKLWYLVFLVTGIQVVTSFLIFFRNIITAKQLFRTDAWISIVDKLIMIIAFGSFFYLPAFGIDVSILLFLSVQLVATTLAVIIAALIASQYFSEPDPGGKISRLMKDAFPFTAIIFLMAVHARIDGFLLERIHINGPMEAGIYASAFRLLDAGNMVGYLVASFLVPFIAHHLSQRYTIEQTILKLRHLLMIPAITLMAVVLAFPNWVYSLLYYNSNAYTAQVLSLCIAVLPAYYFTHIYGSVLTARGLLKQFITIVFLAALANTALNLLLIPAYGAAGSCIAAIASQYLCALLCFAYCSQHERISYHWRSIAGYILTGLILFSAFYYSESAGIGKLIAIGIGCFVAAMIMFVQYNRVKNLVPEPNN